MGTSSEDKGKGLFQATKIPVPNDPILRQIMKETKEDFNDYTRDFFLQTNVLFQKVQKSQVAVFSQLQQDFVQHV